MVGNRQVSESAQPRTVSELLDNTFRQYRTHFRFWFIVSAFVLIPFMVLNSIFNYNSVNELKTFLNTILNKAGQSVSALQSLQSAQHVHGLAMIYVLAIIEALIVMPLVYGSLLYFVTDLVLFNNKPGIDEAFSHTVRRLGAVIVTLVVLGILGVIALSILVMVVTLLIGASSLTHSPVIIGIVAALVSLALLVAVIWLIVRMAFVTSVTLQERKIIFGAVARSWVLTRGSFWRTLGFFLLIYFIVGVLQGGLGVIITLLVPNAVVALILTNLVSLFATPLFFLARANMYTDLRIRTDSLDLHRWLDSARSETEDTIQE